VVVGLLLMQQVERVDKHNTVVGVVDRAVKAALELSELLTSRY
jgi:hypothetical protein